MACAAFTRTVLSHRRRPAAAAGVSIACQRRERITVTNTRLSPQDAYLFWFAGFVLLCVTVVRAARSGGAPKVRLPRPTAAGLSTALAWLIIVVVAAVVALSRHR